MPAATRSEAPPDRARGDFQRLHPVDGHDDIGAGEQSAPPPEALGGAFEQEVPVARHCADNAGGKADNQQRCERDHAARHLRQRTKPRQLRARPGQAFFPRIEIPQLERQQEIELLGQARQHGNHRQREIEQAEHQQPLRRHAEQDFGWRFGDRGGCPGRGAVGDGDLAPVADQLAQPRALGFGEIGKRDLLPAARTRLEPHRRQAEQARHECLFEADILDALVGNGARGTGEDAAFHADVFGAHGVA